MRIHYTNNMQKGKCGSAGIEIDEAFSKVVVEGGWGEYLPSKGRKRKKGGRESRNRKTFVVKQPSWRQSC